MTRWLAASSVVIAGLLLCVGDAAAQFGLKAGVGRSTIVFSPESGSPELTQTKQRATLAGGAYVLLPSNRIGGWQIEALVIEKGAKNVLRRDDDMRLTYLEIPLLVHIDVFQRWQRALFAIAGPSLAVALKASYEDDGVSEDIKDDISGADVGLHAGAGVEIGAVTIDARYIWGLRSVFQDGDLNGTFKNRTWLVAVAVRFGR